MWQVNSVTRPRRKSTLLAAVLLVPVVVFGISACNSAPGAPPQPETITDKGTPFGDLLVPKLKGKYLFAVAENDDQKAPTDKDTLRAAFAAAKVPAEIEVYAGTMHGWCPPDSRVYNKDQAEKAWGRLLATFALL